MERERFFVRECLQADHPFVPRLSHGSSLVVVHAVCVIVGIEGSVGSSRCCIVRQHASMLDGLALHPQHPFMVSREPYLLHLDMPSRASMCDEEHMVLGHYNIPLGNDYAVRYDGVRGK